jgi:hypothetical protein
MAKTDRTLEKLHACLSDMFHVGSIDDVFSCIITMTGSLVS